MIAFENVMESVPRRRVRSKMLSELGVWHYEDKIYDGWRISVDANNLPSESYDFDWLVEESWDRAHAIGEHGLIMYVNDPIDSFAIPELADADTAELESRPVFMAANIEILEMGILALSLDSNIDIFYSDQEIAAIFPVDPRPCEADLRDYLYEIAKWGLGDTDDYLNKIATEKFGNTG